MSCAACFQGMERTDAQPTGQTTKLHGLDCYVASPPNGRASQGIIVIVPDAFGWDFVNNRLLADEYARQGSFTVYLPDVMGGRSCPLWVLDSLDSLTTDFSVMGWLTKPYHLACALSAAMPFMVRNRLAVAMPRVSSFVASLRLDPATSAQKIGVAGFCWGAQHTIRLCWEQAPQGSYPSTSAGKANPPFNSLIDAAFTAHPSALSIPADIEKVSKPLCIAAGDKDHVTPIEQVRTAEGVLEGKAKEGLKYRVEVFEGAGHGWSVRIDRKNGRQKEQAEECERLAVEWFAECFSEAARA